MMDIQHQVINEVLDERNRQDHRFGDRSMAGPVMDGDAKSRVLWEHVNVACATRTVTAEVRRHELIQVAACAVAWVEAMDRAGLVTIADGERATNAALRALERRIERIEALVERVEGGAPTATAPEPTRWRYGDDESGTSGAAVPRAPIDPTLPGASAGLEYTPAASDPANAMKEDASGITQ